MTTAIRRNAVARQSDNSVNQRSIRHSFSKFMQSIIARKLQLGKIGTAHNYRSTLNSFLRFTSLDNIRFSRLTPDLIEEYEAWLIATRVKSNSISFYMRNLRATYNHAVELGLTADNRPPTVSQSLHPHRENSQTSHLSGRNKTHQGSRPCRSAHTRPCLRYIPVSLLLPGHEFHRRRISDSFRHRGRRNSLLPPQDRPGNSCRT